jgi:hypothetical protein
MSEITASVCIRGWRRETLPDAIRSVLEQGRDDIELIVGDELGRLEDIVRAFDDPRVRYHHVGRVGPNGQARALVGESRGRYVALLDDDDRWLPGFLDATIELLDDDPEVGIVFTNFFYDAGGRLSEREWDLAEGRHDRFMVEFLRGSPILLSAALIRRATWDDGERREPLPLDTLADGTIWRRAAAAGWPFYFIDRRLAVYRLHGNQRSRQQRLYDETIATWTGFDSADPECEGLRRRRVAEAFLARAGFRLRRGRMRAVVQDVRAAREAGPGWFGERGLVALLGLRPAVWRTFARHPRVVGPALRGWGMVRRLDRLQ